MQNFSFRGPVRSDDLAGPSPALAYTMSVEAMEFCELAVSGRNLVRCDDDSAGVRGLVDVDTGERFQIESSKLLAFALSGD